MRDLAGAFVAVLAFGIGFGAAAVAANIPPLAAIAMSAFVFAGASQYAALDLWTAPLPLLSLAMMTLAVNARHLIFGMTLRDYLAKHGRASRYAAVALLSDANWASTQQAIARGERNLGYLVGGGLVLWGAWMIGTTVGACAGHTLGDPQRFGLDAIMPTFFVCSLIGLVRGRADIAPWMLAAALASALSLLIPSQWAILIGAGSGALFGVSRDE
ncbi:AzlC family ABC transporter permease [Steroidobacter cummioxidans]|uniref:AzlC family ABC transporter permease n=1 Tax=Steroidobacter cummioxidans TaxID=1803913 RepID=UPI00137B4E58|nr:AzlC family ABC transporter permease [Steroidobacter cummioxidans]